MKTGIKSVSENLNIFVGCGFSHDIKPAISVSALAPEDLKQSCHTDSSAQLEGGFFEPALQFAEKTLQTCHSEERRDEESLFFLASSAEGFLASLGMTGGGAFFRSLFSR